MDLAKIRKKNRQPVALESSVNFQPGNNLSVPAMESSENTLVESVAPEVNFMNQVFPVRAETQPTSAHMPERAACRNPVEIIMSGRIAAGCDEESSGDQELASTELESCLEFLCVRVSNEIYGINIMDIKEIIKSREVTEIPRSPGFVSGVISLRGTIIPVIDMLLRLGLPRNKVTGKERIVVISVDQSYCGLLVDEVIQVVRVNKESMEPAPSVLEGIDRDFVSGIGRSEGRLIIILNLKNIADIHLY